MTPSWSGVFESADSAADATTGVGADDVVALTVAGGVDGGGGGGGVDTVAPALTDPSCANALCAAQRTKPNAAILNPKRAITILPFGASPRNRPVAGQANWSQADESGQVPGQIGPIF
jgi:hypothetical protein